MIWAALGAGVIVITGFVLAIYWLGKARYKEGIAEQESAAFREAALRRRKADEILAEPAADERLWFDGVRDRSKRD